MTRDARFAAAGEDTDLAHAQLGAQICVMRALGSLEHVQAIPSIAVFVQSARHFTQQSEVADGGVRAAVREPRPGRRAHANLGGRLPAAQERDRRAVPDCHHGVAPGSGHPAKRDRREGKRPPAIEFHPGKESLCPATNWPS